MNMLLGINNSITGLKSKNAVYITQNQMLGKNKGFLV